MTKYDMDYVLETYVGGNGPWQWQQYALLLLQSAANSVPFLLHLFAAFTPTHRCWVPSCDLANSTFDEEHIQFSIPVNEVSEDFLREATAYSQCHMFESTEVGCHSEAFNSQKVVECENHVFRTDVFQSTLVMELDLVCEHENKTKLLGSILMFGIMLGCVIGGPVADKLGRKMAMTASLALICPSVIVGGFISNYIVYATLRFLTVVAISIMWISGHALILELFGKRLRRFAYTINSIWYALANLILPLIAYFVRDWKFIHLGAGILCSIALPFVAIFLSESVRWMVVNDRVDEAEEKLLKIAKVNKRKLTEEDLKEMRDIIDTMAASAKKTNERQMGPWNMFSKKYLAQTLVLFGIWMTSVLSFYALTLNVESLAGDMFLNYVVSMLVEIPGNLLIMALVDRIGRRWLIILGMGALGVSCVGMGFIPKSYSTLVLILYFTGRLTSGIAMNTVWLYTAELYPTNLRSQSVATCSFVARIAGMTAPFITKLSAFWGPLPMVILGIPAIIFGLLALILKETAQRHLLENVEIPLEELRLNETKSKSITTRI